MKITSEQEMLDLGAKFAKLLSGRVTALKGDPKNVCLQNFGGRKSRQDPSGIIELIGDVGAGKTTLVRGFAKALGATHLVTSPSYTISKSYALPNGKTLIHYDFYRLPDPGLMLDDLKEKINDNNNIIIVEWGNSVQSVLPDNRIIVKISKNDDGTRNVDITDNRNSNTELMTALKGDPRNAYLQSFEKRKSQQDSSHALRLFLDTSTPTTILKLNDKTYEWHSDRDLAEKLLEFICSKLQENGKDFKDITEITFMSGPGSFTGLRIGAAVVNALAHELKIPLYTHKGESVKIILPDYGRDANISTPKK